MDRIRTATKTAVKTADIPVLERQTFSEIWAISTFQRPRESTKCNSQLNILSDLIDELCSLSGVYILTGYNRYGYLLTLHPSWGRFTIRPLVFSVVCLCWPSPVLISARKHHSTNLFPKHSNCCGRLKRIRIHYPPGIYSPLSPCSWQRTLFHRIIDVYISIHH
jgi:hypothetical protein